MKKSKQACKGKRERVQMIKGWVKKDEFELVSVLMRRLRNQAKERERESWFQGLQRMEKSKQASKGKRERESPNNQRLGEKRGM